MKQLSATDRAEKTRRQIELVDEQLAKEFSELPAHVVHREVARVSDGLLANARFSDHVAVLTGRFAAEHLGTVGMPAPAQLVHQAALACLQSSEATSPESYLVKRPRPK